MLLKYRKIYFILLCLSVSFVKIAPTHSAIIRQIEFPVNGTNSFSDDFGDSRTGGRIHEGIDILGAKMTSLVSAVDGWIGYITIPEASWGYSLNIKDADGYEYVYIHINNDTPGTDDGLGGPENAFVSGIQRGSRVTRGQHIAWLGDSGNAESVSSHLHFEIRLPDGSPINPYESLIVASHMGTFNVEEAIQSSPDINTDKKLSAITINPLCVSGSLIKSTDFSAVYYCGADGKRYVFPNQEVYESWYKDFSQVIIISDETLAQISLGGNITFKPGVTMVKIQTDPKVYAIAQGGVLRWILNPEIAQSLYGKTWNKKIKDVADVFFINYSIGNPITSQ